MKNKIRVTCLLVLITMLISSTFACNSSTGGGSYSAFVPQVNNSASNNTEIVSVETNSGSSQSVSQGNSQVSTPISPIVPSQGSLQNSSQDSTQDSSLEISQVSPIVPSQVSSQSSSSSSEPWVPEIIAGETGAGVPNVNDDVKYDYSASKLTFTTANGGFSETIVSGKISNYTTTGTNNLLYTTSVAFPYGTITCNVKTLTTTDSGIVFGLSSSSTSFWEGSGISYYFFFLSKEGTAYLGKTNNSSWSILKQVTYSFNDTDVYTLKVIYQGSKICCYVNNEFMIGVRDNSQLTGTGFGVRSGASGVSFSNMSITNDYLY